MHQMDFRGVERCDVQTMQLFSVCTIVVSRPRHDSYVGFHIGKLRLKKHKIKKLKWKIRDISLKQNRIFIGDIFECLNSKPIF